MMVVVPVLPLLEKKVPPFSFSVDSKVDLPSRRRVSFSNNGSLISCSISKCANCCAVMPAWVNDLLYQGTVLNECKSSFRN